jgi:hypothetical protein
MKTLQSETAQTIPDLSNSYVPKGPLHVGTECTYWSAVPYRSCPVEVSTPTHWNLIGRKMTASPPSPSSILPPLRLIALSFPQEKIRRPFKKLYFLSFFFLFKVAEV